MRIGTLFSGIGSPEQGASRVYDNLDLVFACEWDKYARESFKANYQIEDKHFHKDIADMDGTQYKDKVDILIGGSPCQDFSLAGLRAGVDGNKGILIYEYIRIIKEVQPPIFIYENVKGMLSDKGGRTIKEFVEAFRDMGYHCHYEVLNTKDYGVPQNRERIFLVGFKDTQHYYNFSFAPKMKLEKRLKDVLEDDVDEKYYLSDKMIEGFTNNKEPIPLQLGNSKSRGEFIGIEGQVAYCLRASEPNGIIEPNCTPIGTLDIKGNDSIKRVYSQDGLSPTLTTMEGGNRQPKIQVPSATKKGYETATVGDSINLTHPKSKTRRGRVGKQVSQTLDCACNQAVVEDIINPLKGKTKYGWHFEQNVYSEDSKCTRTVMAGEGSGSRAKVIQDYKIRKLTPRECFRLQDFPDTFKFVVSNSQLYKQAGNSISVNVMEMIFNQIEKSRYSNTKEGSLF